MRNRITSFLTVCGLAVVAFSPAALSCPNAKSASQTEAQAQPAPTAQVVQYQVGACQKQARQAETVAVADGAGCCATAKAALAYVQKVGYDVQGCARTRAVKVLARSLGELQDSCGKEDCCIRKQIAEALSEMAKTSPEVVASALITSMMTTTPAPVQAVAMVNSPAAGTSQCQSQQRAQVRGIAGKGACGTTGARAVAVGNSANCDPAACQAAKTQAVAGKSACCAGAAARAVAVGNSQANCDPAACQAAKARAVAIADGACSKSKAAAALAASNESSCSKATNAKATYVAFGCEKTDRIARAMARAYISMIKELKASGQYDGCAASAASKVLAAVLDDMQAEQLAQGEIEVEVTPVVETDVAFGIVSDAPKKSCGSKN